MLVLPIGGMGIGVEANGSNFPFIQPSANVQGLLADLWLAHETEDVVLPLRVTSLIGFQEAFDGLPSNAQIVIVDAEDKTIFNSIDAVYSWKDWGTRLRIHEWLFSSVICRVVQHRAVSDPNAQSWPEEVIPDNGVLDERASELMSQRLLLITVGDQTVAGEFVFTNGWNVDIETAPYNEPLRNTTALTFNANAGDGPGRAPGCESPEIVVRTIDGVGPDTQGNFTLAVSDCYSLRQPVTIDGATSTPTEATLTLSNDCGPCCDCDDYVNVQKAILNLEADMRKTAADAETVRDEYQAAVDRWNAQKACREAQVLQISSVATNNTYIDISVTLCNASGGCLSNAKLVVSFDGQTSTWSVVPGTTYLTNANGKLVPYQTSGPPAGPVTAHVDSTGPFMQAELRMRIQSSNGRYSEMVTQQAVYIPAPGSPPSMGTIVTHGIGTILTGFP